MTLRILHYLPRHPIYRRIFAYGFILAIFIRECFTAYYDEYASVLADSRSIICWIFLLFSIRLLTRNTVVRLLSVFLTFLLSLISILHTAFIYGNGNGFSLENCIHILDANMLVEFIKMSPPAFIGLISLLVLLTFLIQLAAFLLYWSVHPLPRKRYLKYLAWSGVFISFGLGIFFFYPARDVYALLKASAIVKFDKNAFSSYGIKITPLKAADVRAVRGKNLVFIILESTEKTFLDEKLFPDLVPNLKKFSLMSQMFENISINHTATGTFGSMFSMMNGFYITTHYMTFSINGLKPHAGNQLSSFPKILNKAGYRQYFIVGHSGNFAGTERFVRDQCYDECWFGIDREKHEKSWKLSVRDSAVFEQAWKTFQKASAEKAPFNITVLSIDAHGPDGYYDPKEPAYPHSKDKPKNLYNAMYASDVALGKLLDRIRTSPAGKDTVIVISSDHLSHHYTVATPLLNTNPERRMLFMIWNSAIKKSQPKIEGRTFDIGPTLLDALGVKHNYVFPLGESLYSSTVGKNRLEYTVDQEKALNMYVQLKSVRPVNLPQKIRVEELPYPQLCIGEMFTPLVVQQAIVDLPEEKDILMLPIPEDYKVSDPEIRQVAGFTALSEEIRKRKNLICITKNSREAAAFFNLTKETGYLLVLVLNGTRKVKYAERFSDLQITEEEVLQMMKEVLK